MSGNPRLGMLAKVILVLALIVAVPVVVYALIFNVYELGGVTTMTVEPVEVVRLDQGWSEQETRAYHHRSQGTKILPLAWFLALEQPILTPLPAAPYASRDYLARFGFLYDDSAPAKDPDLPIGFAIEENFDAPYATPPILTGTKVVGLTCAACHTGRIDVPGPDGKLRGMLIEGGSAMIHITSFQKATGLALGYTQFFPQRFDRFAARVLGADLRNSHPCKIKLRKDLKALIDSGQAAQNYAKDHKLNPIESGYSRTDALALIGNRVFGVLGPENQVVTDAPSNYPHIWDTAWFDWVQYNASIRMPMARNIGEALGVGALVNLDPTKGKLFDSTVNIKGLHELEEQLGGKKPYEGLKPPPWNEELLGQINPTQRDAGEALYRLHCACCHLPPRKVLKADIENKTYRYFTHDPWADKAFLKVPPIDLYKIGTDPNHVLNFYRRVAVMAEPPAGGKSEPGNPKARKTIPMKDGLFLITSLIRRDKYEGIGLLARGKTCDSIADLPKLKEYDRYRSLPDPLIVGDQAALLEKTGINEVILTPLGYKSRPLDGIWATAPYFHNASVPNLYQVLLPASQRDPVFYLGSKRFDPKHVGFETHEVKGAFKLDTTLSGNHNTGHEFRNMTLEELEQARDLKVEPDADRESRWAKVLGGTAAELDALSARERWERVRQASRDARHLKHYVPARGVLGVEFRDEERWQLVEYLKSL